ncbi:hypothetical protein [Kiloniella antarctica]|uniref:Uncharacterized protein n=1 Tax=Kiloniella antarctica TaxID=1550907 RepID=A0ABW5BJW9_9PROT
MRNLINVHKARQKSLESQFPDLLLLACVEPAEDYEYLAVSIFDRWLGEELSLKLLHNVEEKEQKRRDEMLDQFNEILIANTEILTFRFNTRKSKPQFKAFTSEQSKHEYLRHTDSPMYMVVLPEINAVYFEGWDDTNVFYLREHSTKKKIQNWANEVGLHCLKSRK